MNRMILLVGVLSLCSFAYSLHPDVGLGIHEMVTKYGYPIENHTVTTPDGYILDFHRIPHGLDNGNEINKPVAFLMHGLACTSVDWVNAGPTNALAYILANLGYDVWLGNARGTVWGRHHVTWDPDVDLQRFWNFSWHEIGYYDVPTMIDYVLDLTGQENLFYFGHSQGTTAFFVMTSERPEYNAKIRLGTMMAPVAYQPNQKSPFNHYIADHEEDIAWIAVNLGLYEFKPANNFTQELTKQCDEDGGLEEACRTIIFLMCGWDSEQLNSTLIPVIGTNLPGGSATKQYIHFAQEINSAHFRQFDYHSVENNTIHYGTPEPPDYDISKITAPVALHYGQNDWLVGLEDAFRLRDELPNLAADNMIAYEKFNHLDFLWATDVIELLYNDVIAVMENY
jgi:lysosomal acid lipase/cholesteryl ester hydrolase